MLNYRTRSLKKINIHSELNYFKLATPKSKGADIENKSNGSLNWNASMFIFFSLLFAFVVLLKLINIQVIHGATYRVQSDSNHIAQVKLRSPRGVIYDQSGNQLTNNTPAFRLMLDLESVENVEDLSFLKDLAALLEVNIDELTSLVEEKKEEGLTIITLVEDLTKDQAIAISANRQDFLGVYIEEDVRRYYPYKHILAHILGFTGEVGEEDVSDGRFEPGDIVGKEGVEFQYDDLLRGKDGVRNVVIDVSGNVIKEEGVIKPESGSNIRLTIDIEAQEKLYELLAEGVEKSDATGAAAIFSDINTGEVIAAVSLPSYDNNLFVGGISLREYEGLLKDERNPLLNRFIAEAQPPGSTFKTITALAGYDSGTITSATIFNSTGVFYLGNYPFQEYQRKSYGPLNIVQALSKSSNIFFYETVLRLGIEELSGYAEKLGIGSKTGVDLPGEISGNFSSPEYKSLVTDEAWYPGDSLNAAIGQGYNRVTPIQMLRWVSAIGSGGKYIIPHFLGEFENTKGEWKDAEFDFIDLDISSEALGVVRDGMRESVKSGVAYTLRNCKADVAAKTGTAEFGVKNEKGEYTKTHAWITGFFPYEDPKYAFVFFQEAGGLGSSSGEVARKFIDWYVETKESS